MWISKALILYSWGKSLALLGRLTYFTDTGNYSHHWAAFNSQPGTAEEFSGVQQSPDALEGKQLFPPVQRLWPWERRRGYTPPKLISWINNPLKLLAAKANDSHLQAPLISARIMCWQTPSIHPPTLKAKDLHYLWQICVIYISVCLQKCKGFFSFISSLESKNEQVNYISNLFN